jgi:hypothetical protein
MDGKADRFDACKADPDIEETEGRYRGYRADAEGLLEFSGVAAELTRLRTRIEAADKLAEAATRLRKLHEQSLRTADYHNVSCQCPRCVDDGIVAALSAYEGGKE